MTEERVRVGDVLSLRRRLVDVELQGRYQEIGVRSFGRGIFHKEPIAGADLGSKRVFRIEPEDLVISNVFAWEGAIAVASESEAGRIGSHRFMTFVPIDGRISISWASWFFRSDRGLELIRRASPGSAGRNRTLAIDRFEALMIPLPPIDEQRRVAEQLDRLRIITSELMDRSSHMSALINALAVSASARPDINETAKVHSGWQRVELGSVMTPAADLVAVVPGDPYPNVGVYSFGGGLFAKPDIDGFTTSARLLNRIHSGQFIYSRLFAFEGAYAYVPPKYDSYYVSNEFPTFDPDPERLDARWLASYVRSPVRWAELRGASKGLGVRRQRVPVEAIMKYKIWLPPLATQRAAIKVANYLDQCRTLRADADDRIDSLVAAALNQTFISST